MSNPIPDVINMNMEEFLEKVESNARDLRIGTCPVWQCGGELEYLEDRTNWQEPDLRCKNCGNVWLIQKYSKEETDNRRRADD